MIRLAHADDESFVKYIVLSAYEKYTRRLIDPPDPLRQDYRALIAEGVTYVLDLNGHIVGTVTCIEDEPSLTMRNLGVHPCHQKRGYGEQLVAFVEMEAKRRGYTSVKFWTREEMVEVHRFYLRLGYTLGETVRSPSRSTVFFNKSMQS